MSQPEDDNHTADQWRYHTQVIRDALSRWRDGDITTWAKRKAVAEENRRYYGDARTPLTRMPRPYELPRILAESAGVPEEAMVVALNARRHSEDAYRDILATARAPQLPGGQS